MYYSAGHIFRANLEVAVMLVKAFNIADFPDTADTRIQDLVAEFYRTDFAESSAIEILSEIIIMSM